MTELTEAESERIEADIPKYHDLLKSINETGEDLIEQISAITTQLDDRLSTHKNGISILDVKNECMAHYLADLVTLAGRQLNGERIEESDVIGRLIEQRVTLERVRPLEEKMRYRIEKLTALAQGNVKKDDPINLRPDVDNLESSTDEEESENEEDEAQKKKKDDIYRIDKSRLRSVMPPESVQSAADRALEKKRKGALASSVIRELREEAGDEPEQLQTNELHNVDRMGAKRMAEEKRIIESEENNFIRINRPKGDRHRERDAMKRSAFNGLTSFADTSVLYDAQDGADVLNKMKKLKRERKQAKKGGQGGKKRKRR